MLRWILSILLAGTTTAPAAAAVLWSARATDTGIGNWDELQSWSADGGASCPERIGTSASPVPGEKGRVIRVELRACEVTVNPRRRPPYPLGNRSEMVHLPYVGEGDERWYRWRVFFPSAFAVTDGRGGGAVFAQWHHWSVGGEPGSPPLLFVARAGDIRLVSVPSLDSQNAVTLASAPNLKGRWRTFVVHLRFSSDPSEARIDWWLDGARIDVRPAATLFPGYSNYLKMGLYRRPTAREDNIIYFDDIVEGTERADVAPRGTARR